MIINDKHISFFPRGFLGTFVACCLCVAALIPLTVKPAYADDAANELTLEITQAISGLPANASVTIDYELTAIDPTSPMPSLDSPYYFSLTNNSTVTLPTISYSYPGVYEYTVRPLSSQGQNNSIVLDASYQITVHAIYNEQQEIELTSFFSDDEGYKHPGITFNHTLQGDSAKPVATGDNLAGIALPLIALLTTSIVVALAAIIIRRKHKGESKHVD